MIYSYVFSTATLRLPKPRPQQLAGAPLPASNVSAILATSKFINTEARPI